MKKLAIILSALLLMALLASSCSSTSKCAAYSNIEKYQKEVKY
jgi:PBP1b-binding outer membrane lipoprotein LpoB